MQHKFETVDDMNEIVEDREVEEISVISDDLIDSIIICNRRVKNVTLMTMS